MALELQVERDDLPTTFPCVQAGHGRGPRLSRLGVVVAKSAILDPALTRSLDESRVTVTDPY